jgi:hypothetical protein
MGWLARSVEKGLERETKGRRRKSRQRGVGKGSMRSSHYKINEIVFQRKHSINKTLKNQLFTFLS